MDCDVGLPFPLLIVRLVMRHAPHAAALHAKASQAEGPKLKIWEEEDGREGKRQSADQAGAGPAASKASSQPAPRATRVDHVVIRRPTWLD